MERQDGQALHGWGVAGIVVDQRQQLTALRAASDAYNKALAAGNMADMIHFDTKFHRTIVDSSQNKILIRMVEQLQELVLRFRYLSYDDFKRAERMPQEHQAIIDAIAKKDGEAARTGAAVHIERLKDMVIAGV